MDKPSSGLTLPRDRPAQPPAGDDVATNALRRAGNDVRHPCAAEPIRVPGYDILGELGRGGMGVVYRARQVGLNRVVALKMILPSVHPDCETWFRFFDEAETVAALRHPHIVHIHEVGTQDGRPYFSMELADGGSLASFLRNRPQPPDQAAALVETLADAVHAAHQHAVVHRDLKPGNVLLFRNDNRDEAALSADAPLSAFTPKITDFGLAKRLDRATALTQTGCVMGTPGYMAPEQVAGRNRAVGIGVDVYALGAILYELLTGQAPFAGFHSALAVLAMLELDPIAPSKYQPKLPRDLETICLKCLQKDPKNRYGSAAEVAEDLRRFRARLPILARPTSAAGHVWRWCRRKPAVAALAAALALVFVTGLPGVTALWLAADSNRRTAEARSHDLDVEKQKVQNALNREADARADGLRQIARMDTATGCRLLTEGDLLGSLPYFTEALHLDRQAHRGTVAEDHDRELAHRQRIGAVLDQCPRLLHIWFHDSAVREVSFSPDGRKIVTGDNTGTARVWDAHTGAALTPPLAHGCEVQLARFSPDGGRLLTAAYTGVRLWDVKTGTEIPTKFPAEWKSFSKHHGALAIEFSKEGPRVLARFPGNQAAVWEPENGKLLTPLFVRPAEVFSGVFSSDGRMFATRTTEGHLHVHDLAAGKLLLKLDNMRAAAFSPDNRRLVTSNNFGLVQVWDVAGGKLLSQPMNQPDDAGRLGIGPDGERAATAGNDGSVYIWDLTRSRAAAPPLRTGLVANQIVFSPDGSRVATASADGTARLWDAVNGSPLTPPLKHAQGVWRLAFSPDGSRLVTASLDGTARLWEVAPVAPRVRHLRHAGAVLHAAVSRDSRRVVTGGDDRTARIWDLETCLPVVPPLKHDGPVNYVAFDPDAKRVATSGRLHYLNQDVGQAGVWDARTGARFSTFLGGPTHQVMFSPDGRRLMLRVHFQVNVWDFDRKRAIAKINQGHVLKGACFSPDGERVLTLGWSNNGDICNLWMTEGGTRLTKKPESGVTHAELSPDGRRYVLASFAGHARQFDTATHERVGPQVFHNGPLTHVSYSHDGTRFLTCSEDQTARVWDAETGQPLTPPLRHEGKPERAFFHPDGARLATVTTVKQAGRQDEAQVRLWDARTGEALTPALRHGDIIHHAEFSRDGRFLVCACADGKAWVWRLSAADERSTEELLLLSEILSGERREPRTGSLTLAREDLQRAWRKYASAPKPLALSAAEQLAWHDREAATAEAEGRTFTALFHLDRLLAAQPDQGPYLLRRGHVHACAGKMDEAERVYARAAKLVGPARLLDWYAESAERCKEREHWTTALWYLDRALSGRPAHAILYAERGFVHGKLGRKPERIADLKAAIRHGAAPAVMLTLAAEHEARGEWADAAALYLGASEKGAAPWHKAGLVCLKANDVEAYRRLCRRYFERLEKRKVKDQEANQLAWLCALAPDALPDYTKPRAWLNDALGRLNDSQEKEKYELLNTLGALLYRAGRTEDAIRTLEKGLALVRGKGSVQDYVFLALAHHRLGHADEERKWRELTATWSVPNGKEFDWERIELEVLRRELAETK